MARGKAGFTKRKKGMERRFRCSKCEADFAMEDSLKRHIRQHEHHEHGRLLALEARAAEE